MAKNLDYKADLLDDLRNDLEYAAEYLSAAYDDSQEAFLVALRDVAEAQKGMAKVAKQAKVNREHLYRSLSKRGNPTLNTVGSVLEVLKLKVLIVPQDAAVQPLPSTDPLVTIGHSTAAVQGNTKICAAVGAWNSTFSGLATVGDNAHIAVITSTEQSEEMLAGFPPGFIAYATGAIGQPTINNAIGD